MHERNRERRSAEQAEGKLGLHETGRLVDEGGKLKDSLSLNNQYASLRR